MIIQYLYGVVNVYYDFCGVVILIGLIGLFMGMQLIFDINLRIFMQIFVCYFCQFVEQYNVVLFSLFFYFVGCFIMSGFGSSQCNVGNCVIIWYVVYFWVLIQIINENNFVYVFVGYVCVF